MEDIEGIFLDILLPKAKENLRRNNIHTSKQYKLFELF